jgi:Tol biopolymer transport system component
LKPADPTHPVPGPARKIAFQSNRDGQGEVYAMNANGSGEVNLTKYPDSDFLPSWSPDGKKIAFLRTVSEDQPDSPIHLFVMNPDGSGVLDLTGTLGLVPSGIVVWSPDASTIAFTVILPPNSSAIDIWLVHPDGSGLVPLTTDGLFNAVGDWSPDGSKIVYARHTSDGVSRTEDRGIYVIAPDGTGATQLTAGPADLDPTWSPSGNKIAFTRDNDIFVLNANGSGQTNLTNNSAEDVSPSWAPDDSTIAFTSTRTGSQQVFLLNSNDGDVTQLTMQGVNSVPLWSPDGVYIAFTRRLRDTNDFDIWRMDASGAGQIQLTTLGVNVAPTWKGMK